MISEVKNEIIVNMFKKIFLIKISVYLLVTRENIRILIPNAFGLLMIYKFLSFFLSK